MNETFLKALLEWQMKGKRSISINIGKGTGRNDEVHVWVFDYTLMEGAFVKDHNDLNGLDLAGTKRARLEKELSQLEAA